MFRFFPHWVIICLLLYWSLCGISFIHILYFIQLEYKTQERCWIFIHLIINLRVLQRLQTSSFVFPDPQTDVPAEPRLLIDILWSCRLSKITNCNFFFVAYTRSYRKCVISLINPPIFYICPPTSLLRSFSGTAYLCLDIFSCSYFFL